MRFRKHILDFETAIDVPLWNIVSKHVLLHFFGQLFRCLALTGNLHDIKGKLRFQPMMQQVSHNAVSGTNDLGNGTGTVADKILGISQPYIGTMG